MARLFYALVFLILALPASAGELVMFESPACPWCRQWEEDIGRIYDKSAEGRVLPLRRVDMKDRRPADLEHIGGIVYTPTFVVLSNGIEVGRMQGYPGEDTFWWMLGAFAEKITAASRTVSSLDDPGAEPSQGR